MYLLLHAVLCLAPASGSAGPVAMLQDPAQRSESRGAARPPPLVRPKGDRARTKRADREGLGTPVAGKQQALGVASEVAPEPESVLLADSLLHDDRIGTAQQRLLALTGAPVQGFAGLWHDSRDGIAALYLGRLAPNGLLRGGERALRGSTRIGPELEPALALARSGVGALAWFALDATPGLRLRTMHRDGDLSGERAPAEAAGIRPALLPPIGPAYRLAAVCVHETPLQGTLGSIAWLDEGRVLRRSFQPNGEPLGEVLELNQGATAERGTLARGAPLIAAHPDGSELALWPDARGIAFAKLRGEDHKFTGLAGRGEPLRALADAEGGWWLLARDEGRFVLRHLDELGAPDRPELALGGDGLAGVDLALGDGAVYLLTQAAQGHADRQRVPFGLELHRLQPGAGEMLGEHVALLPDSTPAELMVLGSAGQPGGALLASAGTQLLVAFTGRLGGDHDVYFRTFDAGLEGAGLERWNRDEGCSDQTAPDIDALGGEYAVAAWTDYRSGRARVMARLISSRGSFLSREIELPAQVDDDEAAEPDANVRPTDRAAVALGTERAFLVAFQQDVRGEQRLFAQTFDASGESHLRARALDPGQTCSPGWSPDAVGLPDRSSYAIAFVRAGAGPAIVEVDSSGKVRSAPLLLSASPTAARPALCRLDDGRVMVAWDELDPRGTRVLRLSPLLRNLTPMGEPLRLPGSVREDDWDPSLAAGVAGGCVLAFTSGQGDGRDVFVRWLDKYGQPAGPALALGPALANQEAPQIARLGPAGPDRQPGGWIATWLDDATGHAQVHVRRITTRRQLGPIRTLHQTVEALNQNRASPCIGAVSTGSIGVWTDCRRSRGMDVYFKVLGHAFDEPSGR